MVVYENFFLFYYIKVFERNEEICIKTDILNKNIIK